MKKQKLKDIAKKGILLLAIAGAAAFGFRCSNSRSGLEDLANLESKGIVAEVAYPPVALCNRSYTLQNMKYLAEAVIEYRDNDGRFPDNLEQIACYLESDQGQKVLYKIVADESLSRCVFDDEKLENLLSDYLGSKAYRQEKKNSRQLFSSLLRNYEEYVGLREWIVKQLQENKIQLPEEKEVLLRKIFLDYCRPYLNPSDPRAEPFWADLWYQNYGNKVVIMSAGPDTQLDGTGNEQADNFVIEIHKDTGINEIYSQIGKQARARVSWFPIMDK